MLAVAALALTTVSCTKDTEPAPTQTDLLTTGAWRVTAWTVNPPLPPPRDTVGTRPRITDYYAAIANSGGNCELDDVFKFNRNGTYTQEEGTTKCSPADDQVFATGRWTLSAETNVTPNVTSLVLDDNNLVVPIYNALRFNAGSGAPTVYNVTQFDATTLRWTYTEARRLNRTAPPVLYTFTQTYTNQTR